VEIGMTKYQLIKFRYDSSKTELENFDEWFRCANEERFNHDDEPLSRCEAQEKYETMMGFKLPFEEGFDD
jgi:hypothetical protein